MKISFNVPLVLQLITIRISETQMPIPLLIIGTILGLNTILVLVIGADTTTLVPVVYILFCSICAFTAVKLVLEKLADECCSNNTTSAEKYK